MNRTARLSGYVLYHCLDECSKRFALVLFERRNTVVKLTPGIQSVCWIVLRKELSQRSVIPQASQIAFTVGIDGWLFRLKILLIVVCDSLDSCANR